MKCQRCGGSVVTGSICESCGASALSQYERKPYAVTLDQSDWGEIITELLFFGDGMGEGWQRWFKFIGQAIVDAEREAGFSDSGVEKESCASTNISQSELYTMAQTLYREAEVIYREALGVAHSTYPYDVSGAEVPGTMQYLEQIIDELYDCAGALREYPSKLAQKAEAIELVAAQLIGLRGETVWRDSTTVGAWISELQALAQQLSNRADGWQQFLWNQRGAMAEYYADVDNWPDPEGDRASDSSPW